MAAHYVCAILYLSFLRCCGHDSLSVHRQCVSARGDFAPGDIWHCLETFWVVTAGVREVLSPSE